MRAKIASFPSDNGLVPVISTTLTPTKILAARKKTMLYLEVELDIGPLGYRANVNAEKFLARLFK